jgi:DNA invertase Pin-like site-specific DNA recombinase
VEAAVPVTREEKIAEAKRMREQGLTYQAIGEALGHPTATILKWLKPEWAKEQNRKQNAKRGPAKRAWEAGICPTCGGHLAAAKKSKRCGHCEREARRREARERTERFIAMRKEGLLNVEIAEREGVPVYVVAQVLSCADRYGLTVPRSPYWQRAKAAA